METINQNDDQQDFDIVQTRNKRDQYTIEIRKHKVEGMLKAKRLKLARDLGNVGQDIYNMKLSSDVPQHLPEFPELTKSYFDAFGVEDLDKLTEVVKMIRQKLSSNDNPPIGEFLETGLLPHILKFLESGYEHLNKLQYEALWIASNCFSGPMEFTEKIVSKALLETLVKLIQSKGEGIPELVILY